MTSYYQNNRPYLTSWHLIKLLILKSVYLDKIRTIMFIFCKLMVIRKKESDFFGQLPNKFLLGGRGIRPKQYFSRLFIRMRDTVNRCLNYRGFGRTLMLDARSPTTSHVSQLAGFRARAVVQINFSSSERTSKSCVHISHGGFQSLLQRAYPRTI